MKPGTGPPAPGDDGLNTRFQFDRIVVDAAAHTLLRDGELRPIFRRWQQPYPFDEDMEIPDASP